MDGTEVSDDTDISDGSGAINISYGTETYTFTGLISGATYYFKIYAYTNSGSNIDYKTDGTIPQLEATTLALPSLTTNSVTDITSTTATSGGNITSDGGASITARGVCWSTSSNPTTVDSNTNDGTGTGSFVSSLTGLSFSETYYIRAYATNSVGTAYGNELSFSTTKDEPSDHITNLAYDNIAIDQLTLTWTDATGAVIPDNYLIKASTTSFVTIVDPVDGTEESDDTDLSDGSGIFNVSHGLETFDVTGLTHNTTYYFKVYSYTNSGIFIDFKTDGSIPQINATTKNDPYITDISDDTTVCYGTSACFIISASGTETITYQWKVDDAEIAGAADDTLIIDQAVTEGVYTCVITNSSSSIESNGINLYIADLPDQLVVNDVSVCDGETVPDLTATGTDIKWYSDGDLTNLVHSGSTFATGETAINIYTYYVTQTVGNCSSPADTVTLSINAIPNPPEISDDSVCFGENNPALVASGDGVQWYSDVDLLNPIYSGNSYTSGLVEVGDSVYYVTQTINNCTSDANMVTFSILELPAQLSVDNISVCYGDEVPDFEAEGTDIVWYFDIDLTSVAYIGSPFATGETEAGEYTYYVTQTVNNCASPADIVVLTIVSEPQPPVVDDIIVCIGYPVPDFIADGEIVKWYSDGELTDLLHTGNTFATGQTDLGDYYYYVTQTIGSCTSLSDTVKLSIVDGPVIDLPEDKTICSGDTVEIGIESETGYVYSWTSDPEGFTSDVSNPLVWPVITTKYYLEASIGSSECVGLDSIIVNVNQSPDITLGNDTAVCYGNTVTISPASSSGDFDSYEWSTGSIDWQQTISQSGNYSVTVTDYNGCQASDEIYIEIVEPYAGQQICVVTVSNDNKNLIVWEKPTDEGIYKYNIYRFSPVINDYELIDFTYYSTQWSVYKDNNANPGERSWRYKITVEDTCGNESDLGIVDMHRTMYLQSNQGTSGENNLLWWQYIGVDIENYKIYRGTNENNINEIVATVAHIPGENTGGWTDWDPPTQGKVYYKIQSTLPYACYPTEYKSDSIFGNTQSNILEVEAVNSAPIDITLSSTNFDENVPIGYIVGILSTNDPDEEDSHTYSLVNNAEYPDNSSFIISGDDLKTNVLIDYEEQTAYNIMIRTTDNGVGELYYEEEFAISINDLGVKNIQPIANLKIYPNPFNDKTIIEFNNPNHEEYDMIIRDLAGKIVQTMYSITDEKVEITADKFNEGYYIIELRGEKLYRGKLMVE